VYKPAGSSQHWVAAAGDAEEDDESDRMTV